ncbi:VOC family protein [Saccharopolyspora rectivirgula]|jgi:predicted enzyme related to lactoylglutathione lyase|uniref:VOC family protein n=1 Tax=Saccharopolyspora rectivirgula TaxID=28042 RepID=UPI00240980F8|nr:VOC family protein [Saccharopolyspora rectivirgula]
MAVIVPGSAPPRWDVYAGMPCWIELATPDLDAACDFYSQLLGWECRDHQAPGAGRYRMAFREGYPVAGLYQVAEESSRWRLYLAAADCAQAVSQAEELGASLIGDVEELPGVGAKAILQGPSGAEFGLLEPDEELRFDVGLPGTLMWAELVTIRAQTADNFFRSMFGYTAEQFGADNRSDYSVWYLGGESVLARVSMIREFITPATQPHWLVYLGVTEDGADELVRSAIQLGGRVRVDPYDSSMGRVAVLRDPTGARFALVDQEQAGEYGTAAIYDPYDD